MFPSFNLRRRVCLHHAAVVVQKSSVGIEIDTIHDRIRVPTPQPRPNIIFIWSVIQNSGLGGSDPHSFGSGLIIESTQVELDNLRVKMITRREFELPMTRAPTASCHGRLSKS